MSNGQAHRANIQTQLGGMFTTDGTITDGTFTYDESDMYAIITNWRALARSYDRSLAHSARMTRIEPPAEDFASRAHAATANRSGLSYMRYLEHNRNYCSQQADLCQQTSTTTSTSSTQMPPKYTRRPQTALKLEFDECSSDVHYCWQACSASRLPPPARQRVRATHYQRIPSESPRPNQHQGRPAAEKKSYRSPARPK